MKNTDVRIIEIDLGQSVESIIQEQVTEITADNLQAIQDTIKDAAAKQEAQQLAKSTQETSERMKNEGLQAVYDELVSISAQNNMAFMPGQQILTMCAPHVANMISFVGRMRNWLKSNDKPYKLTPMKKGKESGYRLDQTNEAVTKGAANDD